MDYNYMLMTDSDAEMPFEWLERFDIKAILMPYSIDEKEFYFDFFQTMPEDFYTQLKNGVKVTTAQRNPEDFKEFWQPYLEQGMDVLYVGLSSELSGTFNSTSLAKAELAEKYPDRRIELVDTLAISAPQAMIVRAAAQKRQEGASLDEVIQWLEENKKFYTAFFLVDDLTYLKRGGRVSPTAAFFGSMLDIKPILYESPEGKLEAFDKMKGRKKAVRRMVDLLKQYYAEGYLTVCHADSEKDAEMFCQLIREAIPGVEINVQGVGPVIGCHAGPGTLAVCFKANSDDIRP